jgi:hypothetical protein
MHLGTITQSSNLQISKCSVRLFTRAADIYQSLNKKRYLYCDKITIMKNILALIGLVVVVTAGLGWYLGWYQITTTPTAKPRSLGDILQEFSNHRRVMQEDMEILSAIQAGTRTIVIPSSTLQLVIDPAMVVQILQCLAAHVSPGGIVAAPFMTVWKPGDPLTREWEQTAVRAEDGATFRRMGKYWYDPVRECTDTEDRYQVIMDDHVVAEEVHRRSPALRSYTQAQAQAVFEQAGFNPIELYSAPFTFEPVKADDTGFTVVGHKISGA